MRTLKKSFAYAVLILPKTETSSLGNNLPLKNKAICGKPNPVAFGR